MVWSPLPREEIKAEGDGLGDWASMSDFKVHPTTLYFPHAAGKASQLTQPELLLWKTGGDEWQIIFTRVSTFLPPGASVSGTF